MKAKIDKNGYLHIKRKSNYILQECPYRAMDGEFFICGHHCPHFEEPKFSSLKICNNKVFYFDELEDERE